MGSETPLTVCSAYPQLGIETLEWATVLRVRYDVSETNKSLLSGMRAVALSRVSRFVVIDEGWHQ